MSSGTGARSPAFVIWGEPTSATMPTTSSSRSVLLRTARPRLESRASMMTIDLDLADFQSFGIAILIGALIGIEREKRRETESTVGGIRTFVLLSMLGAAGGHLSA